MPKIKIVTSKKVSHGLLAALADLNMNVGKSSQKKPRVVKKVGVKTV